MYVLDSVKLRFQIVYNILTQWEMGTLPFNTGKRKYVCVCVLYLYFLKTEGRIVRILRLRTKKNVVLTWYRFYVDILFTKWLNGLTIKKLES